MVPFVTVPPGLFFFEGDGGAGGAAGDHPDIGLPGVDESLVASRSCPFVGWCPRSLSLSLSLSRWPQANKPPLKLILRDARLTSVVSLSLEEGVPGTGSLAECDEGVEGCEAPATILCGRDDGDGAEACSAVDVGLGFDKGRMEATRRAGRGIGIVLLVVGEGGGEKPLVAPAVRGRVKDMGGGDAKTFEIDPFRRGGWKGASTSRSRD